MGKSYMLGVDLGSGAVKATLLSGDGRIAGTSNVEYPTHYPHNGWAEQEPEEWFAAFKEAIAMLLDSSRTDPGEIDVLAVDSATHTSVLLDADFTVLRPAIFWTDQRSIAQSEMLNRRYGERLFEIALHYSNPVWTLPQLIWVRENEPAVWKRTRRILFAKDYLRCRLTGIYATDTIDAMGTLFFDPWKMQWSEELCGILEFPVGLLPEVLEPTRVVGHITAEASEATGLSEHTQVIAGSTDTALELFAAGAVEEGQATVKLATAGRICVVTDRALPHPHLINYRHVVPGRWYPGTATKACASSFRWFKDTFGECERRRAEEEGSSVYRIMSDPAADVPVGSEGLFFHPYLMGELTPYFDPLLRGSFTGVTMKHTKAHFTRAVLEGVGYSLKDCMEVIRGLDTEVKDIRIIGGGSESPLWRQIIADIMGVEVNKMERDDSSLGSAMLAGVGIGIFSSFQDAVAKCTRVKSVIKPDPERNSRYLRMFGIYKEIQEALVDANHRISKLGSEP
ncbi:MAG: xylulokinase [Spirochaetales bacterium]|nr:xylulokinase [Spirochaetales bacterium]